MNKFISILLILANILLCTPVMAEETAKNDLIEFLEEYTVFQSGAVNAVLKGELSEPAEGGKAPYAEKGTFYIPSDFALLFGMQVQEYTDVRKITGYNSFIYEDLCFISEGNIDEVKCKRYADSISALFGVYVDINTKVGGDGTALKPFRTIEEAVNKVRKIKNEIGFLPGEFNVYLRKGTYGLNSTIYMGYEDSGTEETRIVYTAFPGEEVKISGGLSMKGSDFSKVTDEKILFKLDKGVHGKVYSLNLNDYGIGRFDASVLDTGNIPTGIKLYYNNQPGTIARYPNSGVARTGKIIKANSIWTEAGFVFEYDEPRINRWRDASDPWIWGTLTWEWAAENHKVTEIDTLNKTIGTSTNSQFIPAENKEWYIYNLLEEIDLPNEFFLDRKNGIIYFYPPAEDVKNGKFSLADINLAIFGGDLINVTKCKNIAFENLIFECTAGNGVMMSKCENTQINGCVARNIGNIAISMTDGVNNRVHGCDIYNIGRNGVEITGGDREFLIHGNNEVTNCRIFKTGQTYRTGAGSIKVHGCGNRVANNEIFSVPSIAFEPHYSNENIIEYNEIYDGLSDGLSDMGVWYYGVDPTAFGNAIRYNYFHDVDVGQGCIYLDDGICGYEVCGNLFYNVNRGVFMHGAQYTKVHDNITVNSNLSSIYVQYLTHDVRWDPKTLTPIEGSSEKSSHYLAMVHDHAPFYNNEVWSEKYPQLAEVLSTGQSYLPKFNEVYRNIDVSPNGALAADVNPIAKDVVDLTGNYETTEDIGFVDMESRNFNLKEDAEIYKIYPDLDAIDFDKVGIYIDEYRKEMPELTEFSLIYPEDKSTEIDGASVDFIWQDSVNTNKYRFVLATDKDFKNVINDTIVSGTKHTVKNLRYKASRYYWKVIALPNNAKNLGDKELECSDGYFSFTTVKEPVLDYSKADKALTEMKNIYDVMHEGNEPGDYFEGTKENIGNMITKFKSDIHAPGVSQIKLNKLLVDFEEQSGVLKGQRNLMAQTFEGLFAQTYWDIMVNTVSFNDTGFTWTSNGSETTGGFNLRKLEAYEVPKFYATFDLESGWQGIAMRAKSTTAAGWSGNKQYVVILKKDTLELQSWKPSGAHFYYEYPNDCIETGKEYLIEFKLENLEDGTVKIQFIVDGNVVIEHIDDSEPLLGAGYMHFYNTSAGRILKIRSAEGDK